YLASQGIEVSNLNAPLDNKTRIGNYIVPPAWEPCDAVLKVVEPEERGIVTFAEAPTCINSWSGATPPEGVTAELVDVGPGDLDEYYEGKDVRGKICLVSKGYAWRTHPLAVEKYGALGFVNDDVIAFPPLKTRETFPDVVMWNTLYEREEEGGYVRGFGLTISPRMGDYLRGLLSKGKVKVYARVDTRTFEGVMENPMGRLEGAVYPEEEILMAAHVCHTRPGAIDNAAGCAHITETLRALHALVEKGELPRPKRTIISFYGPEGHHTNVYGAHMERHGRLKDVIAGLSSHCGGDPEQLHAPMVLTRTTPARPHYIDDLLTRLLEQVSIQFPVPSPRARVPFSFRVDPRFMGGDSLQIIAWGIPAIELYRKPNIFWHTQYDTVDKCSPEEFLKSSWVFGTAAWFLANAGPVEALSLMREVANRSEARQNLAGLDAREELLDLRGTEFQEALERNIDLLRYLAERDSIAIGSCAELIRHESPDVCAAFEDKRKELVAELERKQKAEESALREFANELPDNLS
ncbi:MAG TPA: M28 family peptidase, partial [Anaerolineae bacterium]|nr:M28 family peptidase [Anaerolineae bacterium]